VGLIEWQARQRIAKLKREGKFVKEKEVQVSDVPVKVAANVEENEQGHIVKKEVIAEDFVKCGRCGNVYEKSKAVYVALFGKNGCPKCGFSI